MKKIIEGKTYNTKTADLLGRHNNGLSYSDFDFFEESLYRTRKGKYFLAGSGGARTKYAMRCSDGSYGRGDDIILISDEEALAWMNKFIVTNTKNIIR